MRTDTASVQHTRPRTPPGHAWTAEQVRALGATTNLPTAASVLGISRSQAYHLVATDAFPLPVIRAGSRIIVPVAGLLRLLLLDNGASPSRSPSPDTGGRRLDPAPESSVDATTRPPADYTHRRWRHHAEHPGDDE